MCCLDLGTVKKWRYQQDIRHCMSIKAEVVSKEILLLLRKKAIKDTEVKILLTIKQKYSVVTYILFVVCQGIIYTHIFVRTHRT